MTQAHASAAAPRGLGAVIEVANSIPGCTPLPLVGTRLISPAGGTLASNASASAIASAATERVYALPDGSTMSTIAPPQGFLPQKAAPATARAFGWDAPTDPAALAAWRARYSGYQQTFWSVPCTTGAASWHHALSGSGTSQTRDLRITYSDLWGGYVATGHSNYVEAYDDQNIPTYTITCGSASTSLASHWIGLGGYNTGRLIQQGFDSGSSSTATNGARLWYEYLNPTHQNPLVYIGSSTRTGDVISQYMTYSTASSGTAAFHWYDRTISSGWSPVTKTSLSGYYDGTTSDYITEWPYPYLRKFSRETFSAAGAAYGSTFADLFNLSTTEVRMTTNGTSSGATMVTDTHSSSSAFYQDWQRCT